MSRFYVGQRVRIVAAYTQRGIAEVGKEGVITGVRSGSEYRGPAIYSLDISPFELIDGGTYGLGEDQLEPATDSYDVVSWKDCVWQPEHLRAEA